jgi:hypothetical protein
MKGWMLAWFYSTYSILLREGFEEGQMEAKRELKDLIGEAKWLG